MQGYLKGHRVYLRFDGWYWSDTRTPVKGNPRPCAQCGAICGEYDACIGKIDGAIGACCGHGKHLGYIQWEGSQYPPGWKRGIYITYDP